MNRERILSILVVLGSIVGMTQAFSQSANQTQQTGEKTGSLAKDNMKLSIELDRNTYTLRDIANLKISIKNDSKLPIMIYKKLYWGVRASLLAFVRDENGQALQPDTISEARDRPPFHEDDFTSIKPGEAFTTQVWFSPRNDGVTTPGTYTLVVCYQSPVESVDAPKGLNVLVSEMGSLYSDPVTFKVIQ
jgi:hypothetical protein